jgi:hypothetical protein
VERMPDEMFAELDISREHLRELFVDAQRQMQEEGIKPSDRVRACADRINRRSGWEILLIRYSSHTDPLLDAEGGNA